MKTTKFLLNLEEGYRSGKIGRREFLKLCALAGVAPALLSKGLPSAFAAEPKPKRIVHAGWGGVQDQAIDEIFAKPFTAKTGVKIVFDGAGPLEGKVKAMIDAKNVTWDVIDIESWSHITLGRQGMMEPIDYSIVDKKKVLAPYTWQYGVLSFYYCYVFTYDAEKFESNPPKTWADFWDVKKYPGKRVLYKYLNGAVESALMADGVPRDKIYPLDLDRAFRKIKEIKDHLVFYASGEEARQMFLQKEVVMGNIWLSRAESARKDTGGRVRWIWDDGVIMYGSWGVPKGNPAGREWAMRWIAWMQDPKRQVEFTQRLGYGPANPAANKLFTPEQNRLNPGYPDNYKRMVPCNVEYYADNYSEALNAYLDLISG